MSWDNSKTPSSEEVPLQQKDSPSTIEVTSPISIQIDEAPSCSSSYPQLSFSSPMSSTIIPMEDLEEERQEKDIERKKQRKSIEEPKNKRKDTTTSIINFIHRLTTSDKEDKQKNAVPDEEEPVIDRPDKLLIPVGSQGDNWAYLSAMNTDNFRTALDMGNEAGMPVYEWKADSMEECLVRNTAEEKREILRVSNEEHADKMEQSLMRMLDEFRSGQMRSFTDEQLHQMRAAKAEHEDVTNLHLAIYELDSTPELAENRLEEMYTQLGDKLYNMHSKLNDLATVPLDTIE